MNGVESVMQAGHVQRVVADVVDGVPLDRRSGGPDHRRRGPERAHVEFAFAERSKAVVSPSFVVLVRSGTPPGFLDKAVVEQASDGRISLITVWGGSDHFPIPPSQRT